jgi:Tfp pilus assembly PilM family ATPase
MPGKILGIDTDGASVTVVQLERVLRGLKITGCVSISIEEAGGLDAAIEALGEKIDLKADTYISTIPGEKVSYRNLRIPFSDPKKIKQTIAFAIETIVPFPIEDLIVDFTVIEQAEQSEILAASVKRAYIAEYLTRLKGHGVDPDILDIRGVPIALWLLRQTEIPDDGLVLDIGPKGATLVLYLKRHINLIRYFPFDYGAVSWIGSDAATGEHGEGADTENIAPFFSMFCTIVHNTLHAFGYQNKKTVMPEKVFITGIGSLHRNTKDLLERFLDVPVERIDIANHAKIDMDEDIARTWDPAVMDSALALALRDTKKGMGFNFRKDEFEVEKNYFRIKRATISVGIFLLVILSLLIANLGVDYYFLKKRYSALDSQIREMFMQTLPDVKTIVDPVQQMKIKINEMQQSTPSLPGFNAEHQVLDLLRDISLKIPESLDMKMTMISVDPEIVQMKGETDTFNTVDIIKKGLESSAHFNTVTISSANLNRSGKRVDFEIRVQRAR